MRNHGEYLDLHALAAFVALAEQVRAGAAGAANSAALTQQHQQISRIEASLGVKLFQSSGAGGLVLSQAGERLYESGTDLLASAKAALNSVADISENPAELAIFAAPPTVTSVLISAVVERFHNELGSARLRFVEGMTGHIREWLATGRVDVGVLMDNYGVPGDPLWSEHLMLVADEKLVAHLDDSIAFADLASLPMLLPSAAHGLRLVIDRHSERLGVKLNVRLEGDSLNTLMDWVIEGFGVAVLPQGAVETHHRRSPTLRLIAVHSPTLDRQLVLCTAGNKHPSATVRALVRIIREEAALLKPAWAS
ncbi:MAG TPA: LysR substrate-binding domain-containing protein [Ramlibacter sp.]|nr:LysR substrate-binding domain-containing protein [Ramlibacter sp.]